MFLGLLKEIHSLKFRPLFWVWLTSSIAAVIFTCLQLFFDYNTEKKQVLAQIEVIKESLWDEESLWDDNEPYLNTNTSSLKKLTYFEYVAVSVNGKEYQTKKDTPDEIKENLLMAESKIINKGKVLGNLKVGIDIRRMQRRYFLKALHLLAMNVVKIFIVCFLLLRIFSWLILRHIKTITNYLQDFDVNDGKSLKLERKGIEDEFTFLTQTINELEELVAKRTGELELERERLISSAKLAALGDMAGGIAHEINGPLLVLQTHARLVKRSLEAGDYDISEVIPRLEKIENTCDRISKTIRGLQNISRDSSEMKKTPVRLGEIIQDVVGLCDQRFKEHRVFFDFNIDNDHHLWCDRIQISQVLLNLMANAFDSVLLQDEKWLKIDLIKKNQSDVLMITDSGNSIDQQLADKIFNPFFTTKEIGKGTGLGLSISKKILRAHGGDLELDDACKNTRFVLTLPSLASASNYKKAN